MISPLLRGNILLRESTQHNNILQVVVVITVTLMLPVPTLLAASPVPVMMATLEMDSSVQWVSKSPGRLGEGYYGANNPSW